MEHKKFACIKTHNNLAWYGSLLEAIEVSDRLRISGIKHRLLALDIHGEMIDVGSMWEPDCVCETQDMYGGIVANQWEKDNDELPSITAPAETGVRGNPHSFLAGGG